MDDGRITRSYTRSWVTLGDTPGYHGGQPRRVPRGSPGVPPLVSPAPARVPPGSHRRDPGGTQGGPLGATPRVAPGEPREYPLGTPGGIPPRSSLGILPRPLPPWGTPGVPPIRRTSTKSWDVIYIAELCVLASFLFFVVMVWEGGRRLCCVVLCFNALQLALIKRRPPGGPIYVFAFFRRTILNPAILYPAQALRIR